MIDSWCQNNNLRVLLVVHHPQSVDTPKLKPLHINACAWRNCAPRLSLALSDLDLSGNIGLTGAIPAVTGRLAKLQVMKATNTSLSCAGIIRPFVSSDRVSVCTV